MGTYYGKISGIGNPTERINEITADDLATLRYFQIGWDYGVVDRQGYNFLVDTEKHKGTSSVEVGKGIMFAYGYVGYVDNSVFEFIRPSIPQYHIIYVELDRSKIPNTCTLKVKNNQSSTSIERTFRQDYLDKVRTGVFQLPLWRVKVGANGIEEVFDLRKDLDLLKQSIKQVEYAPNCKSVFGTISPEATATTQRITNKSGKIATTDFVYLATRYAIDGKPITSRTKVTISYNSSRGNVEPKSLLFTNVNYNVGQTITAYPNKVYAVGSVTANDDNIIITKETDNKYNISLKQMIEKENYIVTVSFIH